MEFNPVIHTKEFLLKNPPAAFELAEHSPDFASSPLAQDINILALKICDEEGFPKYGETLAHALAKFQKVWATTGSAQEPSVLNIKTNHGIPVAYYLAVCQYELNKNILTTEFGLKLVAEHVLDKSRALSRRQDVDNLSYQAFANEFFRNRIDLPSMAMKLISQGAAYKHSRPMALSVGRELLRQTKVLIEDCFEPEVSLRYAQAIYSTVHHNVEKIISAPSHNHFYVWQPVLRKSEQVIKDLFNAHPHLWDIQHSVDIFCEPSDAVINHVKTHRSLGFLKKDEFSAFEPQAEATVQHHPINLYLRR
jgi:hypothetical protein